MPNAALVQFVVGGRLSWSLSGVVRGEGRRGAWSDAVAMMEYARGRVVIGGGRGGRAMQVVVQEEGIVGLEKVMVGAVQRPCTGLIDLQCAICVVSSISSGVWDGGLRTRRDRCRGHGGPGREARMNGCLACWIRAAHARRRRDAPRGKRGRGGGAERVAASQHIASYRV